MKSKFSLSVICYFLFFSAAFAHNEMRFHIEGVSNEVLQNVQTMLTIDMKTSKPLRDQEIQHRFLKAPHIIRRALQPYGYFKPRIRSHLSKEGENYIATFTIQVGAPLRIASLDLELEGEGKNNVALQQFIKNFPLKKGDVLKTPLYENTKQQFFIVANQQGYIKASLAENKILIDRNHNSATVIMHFATGHRYYFGRFLFTNQVYAPHFLQRFIPDYYAQPFSSEKLASLQQAMSESDYFQSVSITPNLNQIENYHVPVSVTVIPPKSQRYTLGLGYGTFTGPRFSAGMNLRRLTNTGQSLSAQLRLSSVVSDLAVRYYIPGKNPLTDKWFLGANVKRFLPKNGASTSESINGGYTKKLRHLNFNASLNYLLERFKVIGLPTKRSQLLYPSIDIAYVKADDLINPQFGEALSLNLKGASKTLLSSNSFLQGELKGKYFFSPTSLSHVILKGTFGYTAVRDITTLPLSIRFFAGGLNSIRGFRDSSIGPGRYLMLGSIEVQHQIVGNWNGAIFYDAGTATNHFGTPLNRGIGVGIVYDSMIGPIKLYLAQAISKRGQPHSVEFSIGPEF